ncbi:MAG: GNAT family N-acetyltransferase [Candidatus Phosphoribacter sp.]
MPSKAGHHRHPAPEGSEGSATFAESPTESLNLPLAYRADWEADVVLSDGSVAHLRPILPSDAAALREFHAGQSEESIYLRFFAPLRELSDRDVERFTVIDYDERVALIVSLGPKIIGVGRYDLIDSRTAEVAFNVSDHYQGKGIGSILLEHLALVGWESGVTRFVAEVLPQNRKMINVFREAGYNVKHRLEDGVISLSFDITPTAASTAVRITREHRSEAISVGGFLTPRSVAVVGASRREFSIGHTFLKNIVEGGFTGRVYAVNPNAKRVMGLKAYQSISDIPGTVDLVVVAVAAPDVIELVEACAAKGARALVVPSAHFAEDGERGWKLQAKLRKRARRAGLRVVGPNSFGVINNHPDVRLNASLAPTLPPRGSFGLFAQSGALGIAVLASAARRGLGVSVFASAGNRVDVSGNDLMQYWIDDQHTDAVGLYVESIGNPRKFVRIARHLASTKPVIVVKSASSHLGEAPGHLIRHNRVSQDAFDAMLRQSGVIRAENIHQLFDIAQLVVHQPLPAGDRVAVVTNSDALGALTAQAAVSWGLKVTHSATVSPEAGADEFALAMRGAFDDEAVDTVIASFIPPIYTDDELVAAAVREEARRTTKTCTATFLGMRGVTEQLAMTTTGLHRRVVPAYPMPEDAVRAVAAATRYAQWRARDKGTSDTPDGILPEAVEEVIDEVLADAPDGRALTQPECIRLLAAYGIELWPEEIVETSEEAIAAAERVGYPVILKAVAPAMRHQVGVTGVRLDLASAGAVQEAHRSLVNRLGSLIADRFAVQAMSPPGVSCVISSTEDPLFGPVVAFSVAGPPTDLLGDIGYRIPPLTDVDVNDLIFSVKAAPLLVGHKGKEPIHLDALRDLLARVAVLADNHPTIASLSLQPVNCWGAGVDVLGAEITLGPALTRKDASRRAMT